MTDFALLADWPAPPRVHALTTLRHGAGASLPPFDRFNLGNRSAADGDDAAMVQRNRDELAARLALPSPPHWLRQVHGTQALRFDRPPVVAGVDAEPVADAAVASTPGVVLAILTADCLPVVFAARDGSEVGAAHAGWQGLAGGVLEATVAALRTAPAQLQAWLGPAAGPQAYEIGANVRDAFLGHDPAAASAFAATRPGHWRVDLYALARQRLTAAGIDPAHVHGGGLCTISDAPRFFSYRRDRRCGRMATLAWIGR
ncbi:peptidoglycan editing factor PgeF [Xanthomonas hyacinthi]|uniref:Purine nucleoside phosphorylase n=1 Tax=Xanthomonas hyacinthi TaxID=56455 RepID=A0A2S7F3R0_9XANT|nr:peptidoglycan editing factor PgeF [Xanthomonas hyacinthi]KLD77088.1 laccase [Xanthomonas hyacinthi DSM 19077]PPV00084.1 multi-copper polyphenol oxidoreductase [Xanthomonas hyacinthi]QGY75971.1 peptidoglycan editing factor PgeF [Xanthomonas hyacinthi]